MILLNLSGAIGLYFTFGSRNTRILLHHLDLDQSMYRLFEESSSKEQKSFFESKMILLNLSGAIGLYFIIVLCAPLALATLVFFFTSVQSF